MRSKPPRTLLIRRLTIQPSWLQRVSLMLCTVNPIGSHAAIDASDAIRMDRGQQKNITRHTQHHGTEERERLLYSSLHRGKSSLPR